MFKAFLLSLTLFSSALIAEEPASLGDYTPPSITINGQKIEGFSPIAGAQQDSLLIPESLRNPEFRKKLESKVRIKPFSFNPRFGKSYAPVEIIEFMDLGCGEECHGITDRLARLQERHPRKVQLIHIYMPAQPALNMVNFYGKVANYNDIFWSFRSYVLENKITDSKDALTGLLSLGVGEQEIRLATRRDANDIYRELDQERILAEKLKLGKPPHLFVNGIHVGEGGIPLDKLEDVMLYVLMELEQK